MCKTYIISPSTDLFELVVHTGEPALVAGTRNITYINDVIMTGQFQLTGFLFGQSDINDMHDLTRFRFPVPVTSMDTQLKN